LNVTFSQKGNQKLLANRVGRDNRFIKRTLVPKKNKTVQNENTGSTPNGTKIDKKSAARRSTSAKKSTAAGKNKTAAKTKIVKSSKPVPAIEPSDEEIRIRAYFVSERRQRLALPGDANTDWLEAKRQLLSEIRPR
jgi:hypothetical protein